MAYKDPEKAKAYWRKYYQEHKAEKYTEEYKTENAARSRAYYHKNKNEKRESWKARVFKHQYGITLEEKESIFVQQGKVCPICLRSVPPTSKGWAMDHDHVTNKIRGVLCGYCNTVLGLLDENIDNFFRAIEYLNKHKKDKK